MQFSKIWVNSQPLLHRQRTFYVQFTALGCVSHIVWDIHFFVVSPVPQCLFSPSVLFLCAGSFHVSNTGASPIVFVFPTFLGFLFCSLCWLCLLPSLDLGFVCLSCCLFVHWTFLPKTLISPTWAIYFSDAFESFSLCFTSYHTVILKKLLPLRWYQRKKVFGLPELPRQDTHMHTPDFILFSPFSTALSSLL